MQYAALVKAASLAEELGETADAARWRKIAVPLRANIRRHTTSSVPLFVLPVLYAEKPTHPIRS